LGKMLGNSKNSKKGSHQATGETQEIWGAARNGDAYTVKKKNCSLGNLKRKVSKP